MGREAKRLDDDEVASTASFFSDEGDDGIASEFMSASDAEDMQLLTHAEHAELSDDQASVLQKVAGSLQARQLTEWQRQWCTPQTVQMHLDARKGDLEKASEILAEALRQREEFKDVLSFARQPVWQSDFRVLARGTDGHTCAYFCLRNQVDRPSARDALEHIALVLEVAVKQLQQHATTFDVVCDCHGLKLSRNLDPRVALGFASLLKHAFRDRLRLGVVIDAGMVFGSLWRVFAPALPAKTKDKIVISSSTAALQKLNEVAGKSVADAVAEQMRINRSTNQVVSIVRQPTELE